MDIRIPESPNGNEQKRREPKVGPRCSNIRPTSAPTRFLFEVYVWRDFVPFGKRFGGCIYLPCSGVER